MPVLVNPYLSFGGGGLSVVDLTTPWEEFGRSSTIASGKISLGGFDLTGLMAFRVVLSGITITTDNSSVSLRFHIAGSEVSTNYRWTVYDMDSAGVETGGSDSATEMTITDVAGTAEGVGNASTESLGGVITVYNPAGSTYKACRGQVNYAEADGTGHAAMVAGLLENTGAITGVTVLGSSDLTAGTIVLLGLE